MKKMTAITAMVIGLCALGAIAADTTESGRVSPSTRSDENGDGVISATEWTFGSESFTALDTNSDGAIDSSEQTGMRGKRGKGGAGRGKGGAGKGGAGRGKGGHGRRGAQATESDES